MPKASPAHGRISRGTGRLPRRPPVGQAPFWRRPGDNVTVVAARPYTSAAGDRAPPMRISGETYPRVPPRSVSPATLAAEIPKSTRTTNHAG